MDFLWDRMFPKHTVEDELAARLWYATNKRNRLGVRIREYKAKAKELCRNKDYNNALDYLQLCVFMEREKDRLELEITRINRDRQPISPLDEPES